MAKRGTRTPAKVVSSISADLRRLRTKTKHDKTTASKSEERAVLAAIKQLDYQVKELINAIHTWGWFPKSK